MLLATKLHAPAPRADRVRRERLFDRLDSRAALSLVSAPAGFGKSTLVSDWLRQRERPAAWVSLDPADSDLRRFVRGRPCWSVPRPCCRPVESPQ